MKEDEMRQIAHFIARVLKDPENKAQIADVREEVKNLAGGFSLYPDEVC